MKIVVIGAKGMLGRDLLIACGKAGISVAGYDLPELDITAKDRGLDKLPTCDWLVNCAAYTDVDGAESHRDLAFAVNGDGARNVAEWCAGRNVPLLHISTDYVFDGNGTTPYKEDDPVRPLSVYGESKLAGEVAVQKAGARHLIVRTQSLFGVNGRNFVRSILARVEKNLPLKVVTDQVSCPTYTGHLAGAIVRLLNTDRRGIVHVSASGSCSWHEFACAIMERTNPGVVVQPTTSAEFKALARRPVYSVLDKTRYESWTGQKMPLWQTGLDAYLAELDHGLH